MKLFAGAVILCFLAGAPVFAHQQQDEKTQQDSRKQQDKQTKEQQKQAQKEERSRAKQDQKQQRTAQKEQQRQQKERAKQERHPTQEQQRQSQEQAKRRSEQQRNNADQERGSGGQQYAREQRPQQPRAGERGQANRSDYHARDIHPRHGGRVISDEAYDAHFGRDHHFHAHWRHDADRFQYGGYWFTYTEVWPAMWLDTDDFYIVYNYDDDDYYLCDVEHPGIELLIVVQS
jgi:hypothetical protein